MTFSNFEILGSRQVKSDCCESCQKEDLEKIYTILEIESGEILHLSETCAENLTGISQRYLDSKANYQNINFI